MAKIFEYVPYEEYKPVMQRVESCIDKIFDEISGEIDFEWGFVGSANRYRYVFITRRINGNKGFDFDVNLYVKRPNNDEYWKAKFLRTQFYLAIQKVFKK